jgi:hypothetical protein
MRPPSFIRGSNFCGCADQAESCWGRFPRFAANVAKNFCVFRDTLNPIGRCRFEVRPATAWRHSPFSWSPRRSRRFVPRPCFFISGGALWLDADLAKSRLRQRIMLGVITVLTIELICLIHLLSLFAGVSFWGERSQPLRRELLGSLRRGRRWPRPSETSEQAVPCRLGQ